MLISITLNHISRLVQKISDIKATRYFKVIGYNKGKGYAKVIGYTKAVEYLKAIRYPRFIRSVGIVLCITICFSSFAQKNKPAEPTTQLITDSLPQYRVGFTSLFKVSNTGDKNKPFQFQLNPQAVSFIQSYMEKQGPGLLKMKTWAKPYFNLYDLILTNNGVPVELKYLSVIESSLNSNLVSWAGAAGPWQIMPEEAKRLGLKLLPNDERMDYTKSTQAAATILKELYAEFGDWLLVVAAYNGGAGRLRQVIKKKNSKDFWQIQYELPLETRNHVKKFIATHYVFEEDGKPAPAAIVAAPSINVATVPISGRYKLSAIANAVNFSEKELEKLNPQLEKVLSTGKSFNLNLPKDKLEIFEAHKNEILQASIKVLYDIKN
jgi:membrane-bound lytic murein transglycosylase D